MSTESDNSYIALDVSKPIWDEFFSVYPLVVVGTKEEHGGFDLAPKHLAIPMSWENHFGFVCTPKHATYQNIQREGVFTVSYARPDQVVLTSLTASPRCDDGSKPIVTALPTRPATRVDGIFLADSYVTLECERHHIYDDFGENSLITGRIVAAQVAQDALRTPVVDDQENLLHSPLIAYLYPGRFTEITTSNAIPLPAGFNR
jgi:flavin reductase (DIM6/NTAB) family NADH-FMN oxidoreductase RutF